MDKNHEVLGRNPVRVRRLGGPLGALLVAAPLVALAQNVTSLPTIAALRANTRLTGTVVVQGYHLAAWAGGGLFTASGSSCTDNGGTVIRDSAGSCWYRQVNGPANALEFGAYGDTKLVDAACSISGVARNVLVCPPKTFAATDVGKEIYVAKAGNTAGTTTLATTIVSFYPDRGGAAVALARSAAAAVSAATVQFAHDDTSALQQAFNYSVSSRKALHIPGGMYLHHGLNFTGALNLVYGDGYQGTVLNCMNCVDPGSRGHHTGTGVDISGSTDNTFQDIIFFGGQIDMADTAPTVNVLGMRGTGLGVAFSIEHTFTNVTMLTYGPYNLFLYGYEQTDFTNLKAESLGRSTSGNIYLSARNTPGIVSPYVVAASAPTSMTKVSFSGGRCVFAWPSGPGMVLDEGDTQGVYSIAIRDCYKNFNAPGSSFIVDTSTSPKGSIRAVSLENTYSEIGPCTTCREVALGGTASAWDVRANETFTNGPGLKVAPYYFASGLYDSFISADTTGSTAGMLQAPICRGSIIDTGQQNARFDSIQGCRDFVLHTSRNLVVSGYQNSVLATSGTAYPLGLGETSAKVEASIGEIGTTCAFLLAAGSRTAQVLYGSAAVCGTSPGEHSLNAYWSGSDYVIQQIAGPQYTIGYSLTVLR